MPKANYWEIAEEVAEILRAGLHEVSVVVEEELQLGFEMGPRVGVFIERRDYPEGQPLAAGRVSRVDVRLAVWCWCASLESKAAIKARDLLVAEVEEILSGNLTLNEKAEMIFLRGGDLPTSRSPTNNGFISGGETLVNVIIRTEV